MTYADLSHVRPFRVGDVLFDATKIAPAVGFGGDLNRDLAENPSWIAYWGAMAAMAKRGHDEVQAAYRTARDTWATKRRAGDKVTKDALEEEWRTQPGYGEWYARIAEAEYAWNAATYVYEATTRKASTLSSMAKLYLDEVTARARAGVAGALPPR